MGRIGKDWAAWWLAALICIAIGVAGVCGLLYYRQQMGPELFDEAFFWRDWRTVRRWFGA